MPLIVAEKDEEMSITRITLLLVITLFVGVVSAHAACNKAFVNDRGASGADITIDATVGGVFVLRANSSRCAAVIFNAGANDMRCAPTILTVTSTIGFLIQSGQSLSLNKESQQTWKCIRIGGSSTTASILEARP